MLRGRCHLELGPWVVAISAILFDFSTVWAHSGALPDVDVVPAIDAVMAGSLTPESARERARTVGKGPVFELRES